MFSKLLISIVAIFTSSSEPLPSKKIPTDPIVVVISKPKPPVVKQEPVVRVVFKAKISRYTKRYDKWFKQYAGVYLPGKDFRWLKAQGLQESSLKATATSYVGASGILQFMPRTWGDMEVRLWKGKTVDVFNPERNIQAGAYYMRYLKNMWGRRAGRSTIDVYRLALASYNAGAGNILKAQRICGNALHYNDIIKCLPQVTGSNAKETIGYNKRISRFYAILVAEG